MDIKTTTIEDKVYPKLLKETSSPPKTLYYIGNLELADSFCLGIVGTRRCSSYGRETATKLAKDLVNAGVTIISGLAWGIDEIAHKSTLDAGGKAIAVLGTGLDEKSFSPKRNLNLARNIIKNGGLLVSEFESGNPTFRHHFPQRNRIISGLSHGVIIVEAPEKSGALITAQFALDQGREVFALPGPINYLTFRGSNKLIQEGAKLIMETADILEEFEEFKNLSPVEKEKLLDLNPNEKLIFETIKAEPKTLEDLKTITKWSVQKITVQLSQLELKGAIKNLNGQYTII
jgi:DNA processing protein